MKKFKNSLIIMLIVACSTSLISMFNENLHAMQQDSEIMENEDIIVEVSKEYSEALDRVTYTLSANGKEGSTVTSITLPDQSNIAMDLVEYVVDQNKAYTAEIIYLKDEEEHRFQVSFEERNLLIVEDRGAKVEAVVKTPTPRGTSTIDTVSGFQTALDAANDGDVLTLSALFDEDLKISSEGVVAVIASGDTRKIIIDGEDRLFTPGIGLNKTLFGITNDGSGMITFRNIKVKDTIQQVFNVKGSGSASFDNIHIENAKGSGIHSAMSTSLEVKNSSFTNGARAAAIADATYVVGHKINIDNSHFIGNESLNAGGALAVNSNADALVTNSTFDGNNSAPGYMGGAVATNPDASNVKMTISKCYFLNNFSLINVGGAIAIYHLRGGVINIEDSVFEKNEARGTNNISDGGAIAVKNNSIEYTGTVNINGSNFTGNVAGDNGGAMLLEATNEGVTVANVYNNTFVLNKGNNASSAANVGGAIQTYGGPNTVISHNTFYKNISVGSGGGGAIGLSAATMKTSAVAANNIFADNIATAAPVNKQNVATKSFVTSNVANNGNVGYDNNKTFIPDDPERNALVKTANIFVDFYEPGDILAEGMSVGDAKPVIYGKVGANGYQQDRNAYTPSPRIDEMLRTNDPRTPTGVLTDTRGLPREKLTLDDPYYPNAGAIEIYWTKFVTGTGEWSNRFDVEREGGVESLSYPNQFYKISNPPTYDVSGNPVYDESLTFTRNTLVGSDRYGFTGWQNDKEAMDLKDVNEVYTSRKQTYIAQWTQDVFHLDFDLVGGETQVGNEQDFNTQVIHLGANGELANSPTSKPIKLGYVFDGWYTSDDFTEVPAPELWDFTTMQVLKDTTLYAKWRIPFTYIVDFDTQGGNDIPPLAGIEEYALISEPMQPVRAGYVFDGWYTTIDYETRWNFEVNPVTKDMTLYAKWIKENSTITHPNIEKPKSSNTIPNTGDDTNMGFYIISLFMLCAYFTWRFRIKNPSLSRRFTR